MKHKKKIFHPFGGRVRLIFSTLVISDASDEKKLQTYATFGVEFEFSRGRHACVHHSTVCLN